MERPDRYQGRERLSDEEVALIRSETAARDEQLSLANAQRTWAGGNVGAYNNWFLTQMCARFSPSRSAAPWEEGADALVPANQRCSRLSLSRRPPARAPLLVEGLLGGSRSHRKVLMRWHLQGDEP